MFTVEHVRELAWADEAHTSMACMVKYKEFLDEHPTGINANDGTAHIAEIWAGATAGIFGSVSEYVTPITPASEYVYGDPNVIMK